MKEKCSLRRWIADKWNHSRGKAQVDRSLPVTRACTSQAARWHKTHIESHSIWNKLMDQELDPRASAKTLTPLRRKHISLPDCSYLELIFAPSWLPPLSSCIAWPRKMLHVPTNYAWLMTLIPNQRPVIFKHLSKQVVLNLCPRLLLRFGVMRANVLMALGLKRFASLYS